MADFTQNRRSNGNPRANQGAPTGSASELLRARGDGNPFMPATEDTSEDMFNLIRDTNVGTGPNTKGAPGGSGVTADRLTRRR